MERYIKYIAIALLLVFFLSFLTPYSGEICLKDEYTGQKDCATYHVALVWLWQVGKTFGDFGIAITAIATVAIAGFTWTLWKASERQASLSREALIADQRAFIFATELKNEGTPFQGAYHWVFRPIWHNSGDTPTKNLRIYTECTLRNSPLQLGFDFTRTTSKPGVGLIPPKSTKIGGVGTQAPITPSDIIDIQNSRKFLYVWGWATYRDVFPETPQHITRFCWKIVPAGDPHSFNPAVPPPAIDALRFELL